MLTDLAQTVINGIGSLGNVVELLPVSPFLKMEEVSIGSDVLGAIAWIIPFDAIIGLLEAWVAAIAVWYISQKILRWMKIAG